MPDTTKCPHCGVEMEVPRSLRSGEVECPSCAQPFLPMMEAPAADGDEPVVRRRSRRRRYNDDYDDDFDDYDQPSPEQRRKLAEGRLRPAATALIVVALLRLIFNGAIVAFGGFNMIAAMPNAGTLVWLGILMISFLKESVTVFGAWQMLNARSYRWGLTASILMLFPACDYCCWLFYLGFGIWGIVTVNDSDVRSLIRFRQKSDTEMERSHD